MSTSTKRMWNMLTVFFLLLVFIVVPLARYQGSADVPEDRTFINLGLDLKGGVDLVLAVDRDQYSGEVTQEQMEGAIEVMRRKIDPGGVKEIVVQQVGDERIAVQVPGADDPNVVKDIIGRADALKWLNMGQQDLPRGTIVRFVNDVSTLEDEEQADAEIPVETPADATEPAETIAEDGTIIEEMGESDEQPGTVVTPGDDTGGLVPVEITEDGTIEFTPSETPVENGEEPGVEAEEEDIDERPVIITDPNSDRNQIVITGEDLEWVQTTFYSGQPVISFRVTRDAAGKFARHTGSHIGQFMAIALNDEIISCPVIRSRIGRSGQIEGFTADQAKQLEMLLNAGRIPVPLQVVQERTVSPTLGEESIRLSIRAGIIGFILVLLFMLIYYRLPGLLADVALLIYGVFFLGSLVMLNATLTLPGIAGVILSLGMAVDANVIIFERLKEELGSGKTVATAVKDAFKRAWTAILDANVTTLITGFILWSVGSGPIKGFAITLCLGILLSMFTALFVTRNLLESIITLPSMQKRWLLSGGRWLK